MARLIDELRREGAGVGMPFLVKRGMEAYWQKQVETVTDMLKNPQLPVLVIDNVAEYFYTGTDQEYWSLEKDFPNLAPPYPQFWCEYNMCRMIHSKDCGDTDMAALMPKRGRVGQLFTTLKPEDVTVVKPPEGTKWALWVEIFIDYADPKVAAQGPHGAILLCVDADGRVLGSASMQSLAREEDAPLVKALMSWLHPALLAVSFLHCKNVQVVDNPVPPKLAKRYRERHGGATLSSYKTLVIEPLKAVLRAQGRSGEVGLAKALHICRGHFRDYREGAGLFGKYHQLVWTPATVRGTKGKEAPPREIKFKLPI